MYSATNDPFDYQVLHLTSKFYTDYPDPPYQEIIRKDVRPYNCLLIQSRYDYFICIPYRSHVNHKYAYKFKHSIRSKQSRSDLDYTKIVIIKNTEYIGASEAVIDTDEYKETRDNIELIKNGSQTYIDNYIGHIIGETNKYNNREFQRIYGFSTLKYFHKELGIDESKIIDL